LQAFESGRSVCEPAPFHHTKCSAGFSKWLENLPALDDQYVLYAPNMMAVFGAPLPLANKEEAAVRTALEIQDTLPALGLLNNHPLQVGVGIATGRAYVGSIASVDRAIWTALTALGETTNRAARLQALTRELLAAVIVDERTRLRAKAVCQRFVPHYKQSLRGLRRKQNIYALPLSDWTRARTEPQAELRSAAT
jgi:class 3 adenylate cyclase